jgi:hypothetical protein
MDDHHSRLRLAALLAAVALVAFPGAAAAQDAPTTTNGAAAADENDDDALVTLGVLVFGTLALGMTLWFMNEWRKSSTALIRETLEVTGSLPELDAIAPTVGEADARRGRPVAASQLRIHGPPLVHVGRDARYQVFRDDQPVEADWALHPADAAHAEAAAGAEMTMTPAREGSMKIRATVDGEIVEMPVLAVAPRRAAGRVPLVGVGYGGIAIAIFALTIAGAATTYGKLDGAALVTFASAIVGYLFVDARAQQAQGGGKGGGADQQ